MKNIGILALFILFSFTLTSSRAETTKIDLKNDGRLGVYSYHLREYAEVIYKDRGRYLPEGIKQLNHIFRSRDGKERRVDIRVIELVDHLQDHFGAETVELISGYRSPEYNRELAMEGRQVASESLHLQGLAADIHLDEVREDEIFDYVRKLGIGGAGLYPRYLFVHVDVGSPRTWKGAVDDKRLLLGTENNPNLAWSAVTDKNIYARGEVLNVEVTNNDYAKQKPAINFWVERFRKGVWGEQVKVKVDGESKTLALGEEAKFSWQVPDDYGYGKYRLAIFASKDFSVAPVISNEFYVKK